MLQIIKLPLTILDILFPETIIRVVKQLSLMFNKDLTPMYDGRVLMNQSAMNDPVVQAVLKDMQARNWEDLPHPTGRWYISDRH